MNTDILIKSYQAKAITKQIEKRGISFGDLFLVKCKENRILYWSPRSRAGEYNYTINQWNVNRRKPRPICTILFSLERAVPQTVAWDDEDCQSL